MNNIWLAFITGLTTGGLSCFAVQGGLLTSAIAEEEEMNVSKKLKAKALILFLSSKVVVYTLVGFLLGFLGSTLDISPQVQGFLQIGIGVYMVLTAGRLLNIHPVFRYFVIQPPKSVLRLLKNQAEAKTLFTPLFLGALTVLIPCGVTQAMMLVALGSGNPFWGAGIMFAFTLGTIPVFFAIGMSAIELLKHKVFAIVAALIILLIGILSINSGQVLRGSIHTLENYWRALTGSASESNMAPVNNGFQEVNITVTNGGYKSSANTLKVGVPVKLKLITKNVVSCARAFTIPSLNYFKVLPESGVEFIEFTPDRLGVLNYTCSMGMYTGFFTVVE